MISEQIKLQWVFFLGPILANIFVGYLKSELFLSCKSSHVYLRYVNDFFVMYVDKLESSNFLNYLNNLHKTLKFTKNKKNITIYKLVKAKNSNRQRVLKLSKKNTLTKTPHTTKFLTGTHSKFLTAAWKISKQKFLYTITKY